MTRVTDSTAEQDGRDRPPTDIAEGCPHDEVDLLNPWELIRKWVCCRCGTVMTCACEAELATYLLPHQALHSATTDATGARTPVTRPLTVGTCDRCRGERPQPFPRRAHRHAASVVHRYYWRELFRETNRRWLAWCRERGLPLLDDTGRPISGEHRQAHSDVWDRIEQDVFDEVRRAHDTDPVYDTTRPSDSGVLAAAHAEVVHVDARYLRGGRGKVRVLSMGSSDISQATSVEVFAAADLADRGFGSLTAESRPFHCLFAVLMWLWVQDRSDPRLRLAGFGRRDVTPASQADMIWTMLPDDFGTAAYARRRGAALDEHLDSLPDDTRELIRLFDYWVVTSEHLRHYLWVHDEDIVQAARGVVTVLGAQNTKRVLRFLADDYWGRYLGWPDLLVWPETDPEDVGFVEVKSSNDRLSQDQRDWFRANHDSLGLPASVLKVHRRATIDAAD